MKSLNKSILGSENARKNDVSLPNSNYLRCKCVTALAAILELFMLSMFYFQYDLFIVEFRDIYLFMYIFLFVFASVDFLILHFNPDLANKPKSINAFVIIFSEVYLLWGVVITVLDQFLYAQIIVFVTNLMFCSAAFLIKPKTFVKIILPPLILLLVALPYTHISATLVICNYMNLVIIVLASLVSNYLQYSLFENQNIQKNEIIRISEYDELTNLHNRRTLNKFADDYKSETNKGPVGVLMFDIDYFKKYNDYYGHIAGDTVISQVGDVINSFSNIYKGFAARYGGEEFIVIFENITHDLTVSIAEDICSEIRNKAIPHNESLCGDKLSISVGVYYNPSPTDNLWDAIKYADDALFMAKNSGRNKVSEIHI